MRVDREVIAALATPWGTSALAIVRASGPGCHALVACVATPLRAAPLRPGPPRRVRLADGDGVFDDGIVWLAAGPHTYTGEDTAELSVHGNPYIVRRLLDALVSAGARVAEPGELTRRAVEAGRLDLVQAEGVYQAIHAKSPAGLVVARAALDGVIGEEVAALRAPVIGVIAELEARLDLPEDELALEDDATLLARLEELRARALALAGTARLGRVLVEGARVALVGPVNAGKSSLFNALLGRPRALVHDTPGTTRDVLEVTTSLGGLAVTLLDTAGERETEDPIEAAGLALARELVEDVDLIVVVARAGAPPLEELLVRTADRARVLVYNGVDRPGAPPPPAGWVPTVATEGRGISELSAAIVAALVGQAPRNVGVVVGSARQRDLLLAFAEAVAEAIEAWPVAGVAVAADALLRAVGEIDALTGADTREDVLDDLFARFCVGK
jgi:tRNA modification GTPase